MNSNHNNVIPDVRNTLGFAAVEKASAQEVRFTERVQSFEQGCPSGSAGSRNFLRVAAADLFRTIPIIERDTLDELRQAFGNPSEHNRLALRQYVRTLQVLRGSLQASVALEIQPNAMIFQSQETKQDQS